MRAINTKDTIEQLTRFIKTTAATAGFQKVIVAVSGGVDSATSVSLAVRAVGAENVYGLLLPFKDTQVEAVVDARLVLSQLSVSEVNIVEVNIGSVVDVLQQQLLLDRVSDQVRLGNVMARARMIVLYDHAKKLNATVVGTENKSEHLLGYYTRFGDEASDVEPLRTLYKTEVYKIAKALHVPEPILIKAPTAGLWKGQTDEGQFGFTYQQADEILWLLHDKKFSPKEVMQQGLDQQLVDRVVQWVKQNDFKHIVPHIAPEPVLQ